MQNKVRYLKFIGWGLAILYAVTLLIFAYFLKAPIPREEQLINILYVLIFGLLLVGAFAVASYQEWGRKLLIVVNGCMVGLLVIKYIPQVDIVPLTYFLMSTIVIMYFNQTKVKMMFLNQRPKDWKSILLIDDDETALKTMRPLLIANGYSVLTATSGESGLKIIENQKPDLIVLDVILPGIKGREVCKRIKENPQTQHIPVIFVTAKDSPDDIKAEMAIGATKHITKPYQPKILLTAVREILDRH